VTIARDTNVLGCAKSVASVGVTVVNPFSTPQHALLEALREEDDD
jgi:hypothetical protein